MPEEARKGVVVYTDSGNMKHEDASDWRIDLEGNLTVFVGDDTLATYKREFWYSVGYVGVTKPA